MRRTSILLDPGLLAELERIARRTNRPTAHVIREALERYAAEAQEQRATLPAFVGLSRTGSAGEREPVGEQPPRVDDDQIDSAE